MKLRKILSIVLVGAMLSAFSIAFAADTEENIPPEISEQYVAVGSISAFITLDTSGKASCTGYVNLRNGYTASVNLQLQQYLGGCWVPVITWSEEGGPTITLTGSRYVTSGYSYRSVTTATVYDSDGNSVETVSGVSKTVY